jgi:molecular chaperone DnaK (HSP70)
VLLELGGSEYACEQVASWMLKRLRELAEARFAGRVSRAVVAVPVSASEPYEIALSTAARLAGFEIVQKIPEPIAGALAVGLHVAPASRRLLVCDFGGGTFDATLIDQDQLHFNAIGCAGDEFLGGDDFDEVLAQAVAGGVFEKTGFDMQRDVVRAHQLLRRCESVKRQLSSRDDTSLVMKDGYVKGGKSYDVNATIARSWIEPRWEPLVDRAMAACQRLLVRSRRSAADVSHVVLVGGATLMPLVRRKLAAAFPKAETVTGGYAQIAIAAGAVLQTASYTASSAQLPRLAPSA